MTDTFTAPSGRLQIDVVTPGGGSDEPVGLSLCAGTGSARPWPGAHDYLSLHTARFIAAKEIPAVIDDAVAAIHGPGSIFFYGALGSGGHMTYRDDAEQYYRADDVAGPAGLASMAQIEALWRAWTPEALRAAQRKLAARLDDYISRQERILAEHLAGRWTYSAEQVEPTRASIARAEALLARVEAEIAA